MPSSETVELLVEPEQLASPSNRAYARRLTSSVRPEDCPEVPHGHRHYIDRANWLRAAVLGANDGLVSVASLTIGVGGATTNNRTLIVSGVAGLVAGALSMAVGEYISVSSQRDIEVADVDKERAEQQKGPDARARELNELTQIYMDRGLHAALAQEVATELTRHDVVRAHARDELGIDIDDYTNPWAAALASAVSFSCGAFVPIVPLLVPGLDSHQRLIGVLMAVTVALALSGMAGAWAGGAPLLRPTLRVLIGGWLAMAVTYGVGRLFDTDPA